MKLSEKQKRVSTWPKTTLGIAGVRCSWKEEEGRKEERKKESEQENNKEGISKEIGMERQRK